MEELHGHHVGTVTHHELKQSLTTLQLWAIAVGLVISGEYFGWSYGWASAGTLGFTVTALFVAAMYTTFIFSFTDLVSKIASSYYGILIADFLPNNFLVSRRER